MEKNTGAETLCDFLFDDLLRYERGARRSHLSLLIAYLRYAGFKAVALHRIGDTLRKKGLPVIPRLLLNKMIATTGAEILPGARLGPGMLLMHPVGTVIGSGVAIGRNCTLMQGVTIGEKLADERHDYPTIGDFVTIGAHAVILGKLSVGNGAMIGANAVVIQDVASASVVGGVPARLIRARNEGG